MLYEIGGYLSTIYNNQDALDTLEHPDHFADPEGVVEGIKGFRIAEPLHNGEYQEAILHQALDVLDGLKGYFEGEEEMGEFRIGELKGVKYERLGTSENPWEDGILKVTYDIDMDVDVEGLQLTDATIEVPFRLMTEGGRISPMAGYELAPQPKFE